MKLENEVKQLLYGLTLEKEREIAHLKSIGGPTGMRNSPSSMAGLERNNVRQRVINELERMLQNQDE